jgi:diacylglycerol kinase
MAAGAVLFSSFFAVIVGCVVFIPHAWDIFKMLFLK